MIRNAAKGQRRGPVVGWILGLSGLALVGHGLWLPAKAALAQVLLQRSWQRTVWQKAASAPAEPARPWPWADTWPAARLRAPAHGVDQIVLHGASGEALAFAPGLLESPQRDTGVVALAGHRDTHFAFLGELRAGDELRLRLPAETAERTYRVADAFRVHESDTAVLQQGADELVLITCWPLDGTLQGPWRWVVRAQREDGTQLAGR